MVDTAHATITIPDVTETPFAESEPSIAGDTGGGGGGRSSGGRTRSPAGGRIDLRNTWQIVAGSILIPLGVVFILMAWYGAAHTSYVQQQIPYLVSGSFVGLGCLVLGGLLYWAHWLYRLYDQADLHHQEQLQALEQTLRAMGERMGAAGTAVPGPATGSTGPAGGSAIGTGSVGRLLPPPPIRTRPAPPSYVVTPSGSVYHLPNCPVVAHHPEGLRSVSPTATADLLPCRICLPDVS